MAEPKTAVDQRAESVTMIPIGKVRPAGDNPRKRIGDLTELVESIEANGIIEPLVVVVDGGDRYKVVVGHRRRAAGELAKLQWLPCIVRTYDDVQRQVVMLVENLQREDLSPLEEASSYQLLVDAGRSQRDIAALVGKSQAHVSKHLGLLQLPEKAREAVDSGRISKEDAFELSKLADHPEVIEQVVNFKGRSMYADIPSHARGLVDQAVSEKARKATRDRLLLEGKQVIGEASGSYMAGPYYPGTRLEDLERRSKKFDAVAHEKLKCHGYWIGWDGTAIASCADANKHSSPSRVKVDPAVERREKERETARLRHEELAARRHDRIEQLLAGKLGAEARDHVVRQAIFLYEPQWDLAIGWLHIDQPEDFDDQVEVLISLWVSEAPSTRQLQAALAMVLEGAENHMRWHHSRTFDEPVATEVRHHLEFLASAGIDLSPEEQAYLVVKERPKCTKCGRDLDEDEDSPKFCQAHAYLAAVPEGVDIDTVAWLARCPDNDPNWKSAFERAGRGELEAAAVALRKSSRPRKSALTKIEARIRKLAKANVDEGAGDPAASRESDEAAPSSSPVAEGSEGEAYTQPGAAAPSAVGSPDLEQESLGDGDPGAAPQQPTEPVSVARRRRAKAMVEDRAQAVGLPVDAPARTLEEIQREVVDGLVEEAGPEDHPKCERCLKEVEWALTLLDQAKAADDTRAAAEAQAFGDTSDGGICLSCWRKLEIRFCRNCGCTDEHACPEGCNWIENDLCSSCRPALVAEPIQTMGAADVVPQPTLDACAYCGVDLTVEPVRWAGRLPGSLVEREFCRRIACRQRWADEREKGFKSLGHPPTIAELNASEPTERVSPSELEDEEDLPEQQPCPVCKRPTCAHTWQEKGLAALAAKEAVSK